MAQRLCHLPLAGLTGRNIAEYTAIRRFLLHSIPRQSRVSASFVGGVHLHLLDPHPNLPPRKNSRVHRTHAVCRPQRRVQAPAHVLGPSAARTRSVHAGQRPRSCVASLRRSLRRLRILLMARPTQGYIRQRQRPPLLDLTRPSWCCCIPFFRRCIESPTSGLSSHRLRSVTDSRHAVVLLWRTPHP